MAGIDFIWMSCIMARSNLKLILLGFILKAESLGLPSLKTIELLLAFLQSRYGCQAGMSSLNGIPNILQSLFALKNPQPVLYKNLWCKLFNSICLFFKLCNASELLQSLKKIKTEKLPFHLNKQSTRFLNSKSQIWNEQKQLFCKASVQKTQNVDLK